MIENCKKVIKNVDKFILIVRKVLYRFLLVLFLMVFFMFIWLIFLYCLNVVLRWGGLWDVRIVLNIEVLVFILFFFVCSN